MTKESCQENKDKIEFLEEDNKRLWIELSKMEGRVRIYGEQYVDREILRSNVLIKEINDKAYAIKLVEIVVFSLVGLILTGVILALLGLVLLK